MKTSAAARPILLALLAVGVLALAGCGGGGDGTTAAVTTTAAPAPHWKAWLCRPGDELSACDTDLSTTAVDATGSAKVQQLTVPKRRPIDCFYVYPSVTSSPTGNASLRIGPELQQAAIVQAAQFERVCRVYAPVYRQVTSSKGDSALAYRDVLAAWRDYLAHDNKGRGVVLIGHSQGAQMLKQLVQKEIDPNEATRKLLVSAILLGASIAVEQGSDVGGDFVNVPACRSKTQTGCVVAYSAFARTPPPDAAFQNLGDPEKEQILCVNPGAPQGGKAPITPAIPWFSTQGVIPDAPSAPPTGTEWISLPGLYTARCVEQGTRAWLLVEPIGTPGDPRPVVPAYDDPRGLHAADVSIALETLVALVRSEGKAWLAAQ
jgi:pimeloyl-ACP methyl ester carboxylesterase